MSRKPHHSISTRRKLLFFRHLMVTFLAIAIMGFFAIITVLAKPLDPIKKALRDFSFTDIYYEILSEGEVTDTSRIITIVDLTKVTRRADIAQVLLDIEACHPKVIGLDCCFDNEGDDFDGNDSLISVAEKYKNIVYAEKMLDWSPEEQGWTKVIHSFFYDLTPICEGTVNMPHSLYDRIVRKVPLFETYKKKRVPSFVTQVSRKYADKDVARGRTEDININFSPTVFRVVQPEEVLRHRDDMEGQIVLFGSMYEDADMHWTPIGKMAGVEMLAYSVQSLLLRKEISYVPFIPFCIITLVIIFLVQVAQTKYLQKTGNSKKILVRYVIGAPYFLNMLTFLCLSVFVGVSFFVFKFFNVSFNMAWALAVIAFLGTSRGMYKSIKDYVKAMQNKYKSKKDSKKYKLIKSIKL